MATQTKGKEEKRKSSQKENKSKVVISEQNMKNTVRNPKCNPATVIEVTTKPEKKVSDYVRQ